MENSPASFTSAKTAVAVPRVQTSMYISPVLESSGPIVVMILEKENAVISNRKIMGATNPKDADQGTIRKKYGISIDKNSVHGSDSVENAKIEIDFFYKDHL